MAAAERKPGEWVSVKDALPEDSLNYPVVVFWRTHNDAWVSATSGVGVHVNVRKIESPARITHWMPLPAPPTEAPDAAK